MSCLTGLKLGYIGSKRTLLPLFAPVFDKYLSPSSTSTFADYFCGTGAVSAFIQARYPGVTIHCNDLQTYATTITSARLATYTNEEIGELRTHLYTMSSSLTNGFFTTHYKGKYFTEENCQRLDGARQYLQAIQGEISPKLHTFLLASLISSADTVANTASVYSAYLKKIKPSALKPLKLTYLPTPDTTPSEVIATTENVCTLDCDKLFDVLYLDPPYNSRQYGSNYHVLETIATYDEPTLSGITLLPSYVRSSFCSKAKQNALEALRSVIERFKWKVVMLSYSSDGIMTLEEIVGLLLVRGRVIVYKVDYKRFQSHGKDKKEVVEYLIVCEGGERCEKVEIEVLG